MSIKISLSIAAALAFSAVAGAARADTASDRAAVESVESGIPDSVDYGNREVSQHSPTIDEIDAAESGNPHSVNYGDRDFSVAKDWKDQAAAGEVGNPHDAQPRP